jgi:hypothetical protein
MIAAIHQPNFFPWPGYFRKIARADTFIFLDCVQFSRGTWTNRVKLLVGGEPRWVTCPFGHKSGGFQIISDIIIDDSQPWRARLCRTLEVNYRKAPYFDTIFPQVATCIRRPETHLSAYNIRNIIEIARLLGLDTDFALASALMQSQAFRDSEPSGSTLSGSSLLVRLCLRVGADHYLAGDGAEGYEQPEIYDRQKITLLRNGFVGAPYPQTGTAEFRPGLSILDALFNLGPEAAGRLVKGEAEA